MVSSTGTSQTQPQKSTWLIKVAWILFILCGFILLLYALIPPVARYLTINQLEQRGMADVHFEEISWEPWTPALNIKNLGWKTQRHETVNIDHALVTLDWSALMEHHVLVKQVEIEGLKLPVQVTPELLIAGFEIPKGSSETEEPIAPETESQPWDVTVEALRISGTDFHLEGLPTPAILVQQAHQFSINELTLSDFSTLKPEDKANLVFKGAIDDLAFEINTNAAPLSDTQSIDGKITILPVGPFAQAQHWLNKEVLQGISGDGDIGFSLAIDHHNKASGRALDLSFSLQAPELQTEISRSLAVPADLYLSGLAVDLKAQVELNQANFKINADSSIKAQKAVAKTENGIEANLGELSIKTKITDTQGKITALEQVQANVQTDVTLGSLHTATASINPLLDLKNFATTASLNGKTISIPQVTLEDIYALREDTPLLKGITLDSISVGRNELGDKALQIGQVELNQLTAVMDLDKDGKLEIVNRIEQLQKELGALTGSSTDSTTSSEETEGTSPKKPSFEWLVESFELKAPSRILINDKRDTYNVSHDIAISEFKAQNLSMSQPSKLKLAASLNDNGDITSQGTITLADLQANTDLTTDIEGLSLASLSPYITPVLGYKINTGSLDSQIKLQSQAGSGDSKVHVEVQKLDMDPADQNVIASLSKELTMPLDLSLSLLKNKNDVIILDIPIEMKEDGINTQIAPVIRQAIARAAKNASMTYLKLALQPYGSIMMLAEKSGELMKEMQLVNIPFESMSSTIGPNQEKPAEKLVSLLQNNGDMSVKLCPVATYAEAQELAAATDDEKNKALEILAQQRAQSLKDFFKSQDIKAKRLIICAPQVKKTGQGEVKVSL